MAKLKNFFLSGLVMMYIISVAESQTIPDAEKLQTNLKNNLKATRPLLLKNKSSYYQPLMSNIQTSAHSSKTIDIESKWVSTYSSSNPPAGVNNLSAEVDELLADVENLFGNLPILSSINNQQKSRSRKKRGIIWDIVTLPYTIITFPIRLILFPFRGVIWAIRSFYRTLLTFI